MEKNERNTNIDLLRVISMVMILCLHTLNLAVYNKSIWSYNSGYHLNFMSIPEVIIELFSVIAVNVFGLISGYLMWQAKFKLSRLLSLYFQTAFYTIGITFIFSLIEPNTVSLKEWCSALLAITQYWYIKSYFALLCIIPLLVAIINYQKDRLVGSIILLFFISIVSSFIPGDLFCVHWGFSFVWLSVLFVIGGIIRAIEYDKLQTISTRVIASIFACSLAANILQYYTVRTVLNNSLQNKALFILNSSYVSPIIIIQSLAFFLLMLRCRVSNTFTQKTIAFFGPLTLAVYLIHMQPLFMEYILRNLMKKLGLFGEQAITDSHYLAIYLSEIGIIVSLFFSCCAIDYIRLQIFKLLKIKTLGQRIDNLFVFRF